MMNEPAAYGLVDKAVPFFFALIAVELLASRISRRRVYRLNDSIADLTLGGVSELAGMGTKVLMVAIYVLISDHLSLQVLAGVPAIPASNPFGPHGIDWVVLGWWILAFLLVDHQYYWGHRFCHEVNLAWSAHVAHHSSEEFNLVVALRQSATQSLFTMWFYFPLAFVGFTVVHFVVCLGINLIYQFWVHTRLIGRLGPIEWIMNTPSHHRVHHGRNPKYIDCNHAGVFILWDRLYGTFVREEEEPVYGLTSQLSSHNPIWSNIHHYVFVWRTFHQAHGLRDKLLVLLGKTGWRPDYLGGPILPSELPADYTKYDPVPARPVAIYVTVQFVIATVMSLVITTHAATADRPEYWLIAGGIVLTLFSFSNAASMLDGRRWVAPAEVVRLLAMLGFALVLMATRAVAAPWCLAVAMIAVSSLAGLFVVVARRDRAGAAGSLPHASGNQV